MKISFRKYQGTGNDFILIDNRNEIFPKDNLDFIKILCNRKFGIGSDGLILIENTKTADFEMIFFNPDGSKSLCGNGSRCAVKFAFELGIIGKTCNFLAYDGKHKAIIDGSEITIEMRDVETIKNYEEYIFLNTGSPHVVVFSNDLDNTNVLEKGREIRYSKNFESIGGVNVNFVQLIDNLLHIRTYERGVEDETLSCGTGVTAAAIALATKNLINEKCNIVTKGGNLKVGFKKNNDFLFNNITLTGPAVFVFEGTIEN
jgi:diaminopimelate epimerase